MIKNKYNIDSLLSCALPCLKFFEWLRFRQFPLDKLAEVDLLIIKEWTEIFTSLYDDQLRKALQLSDCCKRKEGRKECGTNWQAAPF